MIIDRCLPIIKSDSTGPYRPPYSPLQYYDYWVNYCDGLPTLVLTSKVKELKSVWGGKLYDVIGQPDLAHIEFDTAEQLTTFILRWS